MDPVRPTRLRVVTQEGRGQILPICGLGAYGLKGASTLIPETPKPKRLSYGVCRDPKARPLWDLG